jgi:D-amino-acid dehydrogenase
MRIRAAGIAEIAGYDRSVHRAGLATVTKALSELFPQLAATGDSQASAWAGLRPMTPDGPPYLGATAIANLYVNAGQGSNGWTQACGCGRIVADIVSGKQPDIDLDGYEVGR